MKKNLVALLLVLAVVSFGVFAATSQTFDLQTVITGVTELKLKSESVSDVPGYNNGTNNFTDSTVTVQPSEVGSAKQIAYIATKSNNRTGITLSVTAEAMSSSFPGGVTKYINYTIDVGGQQETTDGANNAVIDNVFGAASSGFTGVSVLSSQITITVDADEYAAAATGTYIGTVTFNVQANG